ncbi:hypothetical protein DL93DRAFT_237543 [Clavulina sp. PMI_390]|nr:hypothetical protein DL93DRAFT_237543 [Clavulina sp. PMI_390]
MPFLLIVTSISRSTRSMTTTSPPPLLHQALPLLVGVMAGRQLLSKILSLGSRLPRLRKQPKLPLACLKFLLRAITSLNKKWLRESARWNLRLLCSHRTNQLFRALSPSVRCLRHKPFLFNPMTWSLRRRMNRHQH